jgi:hypothetical protein
MCAVLLVARPNAQLTPKLLTMVSLFRRRRMPGVYFVAWSGQGYAHSSGCKSMELHYKMHQIALRCPSKNVRETERGRESLREIVSREISILKNLRKYVSALILILQCVSSRMRCLGTSLKSENIFRYFKLFLLIREFFRNFYLVKSGRFFRWVLLRSAFANQLVVR